MLARWSATEKSEPSPPRRCAIWRRRTWHGCHQALRRSRLHAGRHGAHWPPQWSSPSSPLAVSSPGGQHGTRTCAGRASRRSRKSFDWRAPISSTRPTVLPCRPKPIFPGTRCWPSSFARSRERRRSNRCRRARKCPTVRTDQLLIRGDRSGGPRSRTSGFPADCCTGRRSSPDSTWPKMSAPDPSGRRASASFSCRRAPRRPVWSGSPRRTSRFRSFFRDSTTYRRSAFRTTGSIGTRSPTAPSSASSTTAATAVRIFGASRS